MDRKPRSPRSEPAYIDAEFAGSRIASDRQDELSRHDDLELAMTTRGRAALEIAGDRIALPVGRLTVFWAGRAHRVTTVGATEVKQVTVPFAWLTSWNLPEELTRRLLQGMVLQQPEPRTSDRERMDLWHAGAASPRAALQQASTCEIQARVLRLWAKRPQSILRPGESSTETSSAHFHQAMSARRIDQALRHINSNFRRRLTVAEIAASAGVHPNYLAALFHNHLGSSPSDVLTMQRVRHAQRLLATTIRKTLDIAFECGFPSQSRFYAAFARFCAKTPGDYRRALPHQITLTGTRGHDDVPDGRMELAADVRSDSSTIAAFAPMHVLWVDDLPLNNLDERRMLAAHGLFTDSYVRNRDAIDALRAYPYLLAISDLARAGGRETGWDFLRSVRAMRPDLPVLFFTDRVTPALLKRARRAGAQGLYNQTSRLIDAVLAHARSHGNVP